jgi:hypothetical protein
MSGLGDISLKRTTMGFFRPRAGPHRMRVSEMASSSSITSYSPGQLLTSGSWPYFFALINAGYSHAFTQKGCTSPIQRESGRHHLSRLNSSGPNGNYIVAQVSIAGSTPEYSLQGSYGMFCCPRHYCCKCITTNTRLKLIRSVSCLLPCPLC